MKETELGCLWITTGHVPLCFCSNCQHIYTEKKTSLNTKVHIVKAGDPIPPLAVSSLSSSHKALLYVMCEGTMSNGAPIFMRMTLCSGKHSDDLPIEAPYLTYHHWSLFHQQFLEFTVSPTMIPDEPIPYTDEAGMSEMAILGLRGGIVTNILSQAMQIAGFRDLNAFLSQDY
jgi:hypothetical protein